MRKVIATVIVLALAGLPAAAQYSGSDGVYGGYTGSSMYFNRSIQSMQQRALAKSALARRHAHKPASRAGKAASAHKSRVKHKAKAVRRSK